MKLRFLFLGKTRESFLAEGVAAFVKRLKPMAQVSEVVLKGANLAPGASAKDEDAAREKEAAAILGQLAARDFLVLLDVAGETMSSEKFAAFIAKKRDEGLNAITFALGGPWGLDTSLVRRADLRLSLSPMTFTHEMARLLLLEQVYRAFNIMAGTPYHK